MSKRISNNLELCLRNRLRHRVGIGITRLEQEVFGGVTSNQSIAFWYNVVEAGAGLIEQNWQEYLVLTYCLFIAMTDQEIDDIVESYFDSPQHRAQVNMQAGEVLS